MFVCKNSKCHDFINSQIRDEWGSNTESLKGDVIKRIGLRLYRQHGTKMKNIFEQLILERTPNASQADLKSLGTIVARDALTAVVVWLDEHLDSGADSEGVHIRYFLESRASASQASFLLSVEHQIEENA